MALPDPSRSRVVLIGASRFTDEELPDLPAVRNNLDGLAASLRGAGRCTVVADPESPVALVDPIHDAASEAEDTLIIYYAGHGLVHPRTLGLLLAVVGSAPGRSHTAVPYDQVRECLVDSPAARKVVILDCCYSGRALGGMADPTTAVADEATVEGTYLLASAPPNKQALSPPGERYTSFTGALLTLLNEGIPDGPQHLQLNLIYRHVRDALRRAALPEPQLRAANTAGELALVRNPWHRRPVFEPIPGVPIIDFSPPKRDVRERLKELLRERGLDKAYACPVCEVTVSGKNLVRHFDSHAGVSLDPAKLTLHTRPVLLYQRYELGERIARNVQLATDTETGQTVVVKQFPTASGHRLEHPGIVRVLDIQPSHVVLEYVDGRILTEVLRANGPMAVDRAVQVITEVCEALGYAHQQGVVHGDVRSDNVMLTQQGSVKMLNFGVGIQDSRTDVYSAARLLVELLTGRMPTFGDPPPPGLPPWLDKALRTALHPDVKERYQTAGDLMRALRQ